MKTIFENHRHGRTATCLRNCASLMLLVSSWLPLPAQEKKVEVPAAGFIRIANAVAPGTGGVKVMIDGRDVYPPGYKFGAVTGGISLTPGSHAVSIRREGVKEGVTQTQVEKNQTITLIPFAERMPATDQEPAHFAVRILRLKQKEIQNGRSATFVSVSGQPEVTAELRDPSGKWVKVFVKRLAIGEAVIQYPEGYVPVRVNGKDMESIPIGDPGNYVVVLYDDADGNLRSANFRDFKFLSAD
jgi:hypothetical protein